MKSFFYSNNDDDFFLHRWNFRLNTICRNLSNGDLFTGPKDYCSQFFADSTKFVSTATVYSSNGIKSFFYSNNDDDFFLHRWNFRLNTICRSVRNGDLFTGPKDYCSQFFADSVKFVSTATVHSSNGIKSFFYSNNDDDFFFHRWNFPLNTICTSLRNGDLFTGPKDYCWQFFTDSSKYVSTATVHSSKGIKSFFYSDNDDDFFLHRWNFLLNTICRSLRNGDLFTGPKDYCSQFFADSTKYISTATVHSWNGIKPFFYWNNDDDFFLHRWNFRLNTICRSLSNGDLFNRQKDYCSQFFGDYAKYVSTATVLSSNGIKSFFYSNIDDDFFFHRWNFSLNTICRSLRNRDLFTGPKDYCSQFFADSTKFVSTSTVQSSNGIRSFFLSNNDDDFFFDRWNFRLNTICRSLRNGDLFTGPKDYCWQFFTDSAKYVSTATVHSSKGIKLFFYSDNYDDFFLHRWNFRLNTICRSLRNADLFTGRKDYCSQFFADSTKYISTATVHSWNGIKPFFYWNYDDDFFLHRGNFRSNTICRSLRNRDLFTGPKDYCSQFFADSTKFVSTGTVHSSNGIKSFF